MIRYGDKPCHHCGLMVAEYLNGGKIPTFAGPSLFLHEACINAMKESMEKTSTTEEHFIIK